MAGCAEPRLGCQWGFSDLGLGGLWEPRAASLVQATSPLRSACLERRCVAPPASPRAPRDSPSFTPPVSALAGRSLSTCPCCRSRFDGIRPQVQRQAQARAPPSSSRRSAIFIAGTPASAKRGGANLRALPLARPSASPRPRPTVSCLLAGARVDFLKLRGWRIRRAHRLRARWPRSSTSYDDPLRPLHPPQAPTVRRPFKPLP